MSSSLSQGYSYFARFATSPLIPFGQDVAERTGFTPEACVAVLNTELDPVVGVSSELKNLLGEDTVFALIGKITGFESENNPESSVEFTVVSPLVPKNAEEPETVFKEMGVYGQKNYWGLTRQTSRIVMKLYGEHENGARLNEFWTVFLFRLLWGDAIPHAALVAREHLKIWRAVGSLYKQFQWMNIPANSMSGGVRESVTTASYADAAVKLFSTRFLDAASSFTQKIMEKDYPEYWLTVKNANALKKVDAPKPFSLAQAASGGSKPMLYAGLAMGAVGAYLLSKGKR